MTGSLRWPNQQLIAERLRWPAGALETCRRLEDKHDGWYISWIGENVAKGWERPAGYLADRSDVSLVGADELRRAPEDGIPRSPRVFAETPDELASRIAAVMERVAEQRERRDALWRSMRRGIS